jgi:hypothetical protein
MQHNETTIFIRLQELDGYTEKFDEFLKDCKTHRYIGVRHSGKTQTNYHWHFIISTNYSVKDIRNRVIKHFKGSTGNKHHSLKKSDGNIKNYSYIFKEHARESFKVIQDGSFTDKDIQQFKELNNSIQQEIKDNTPEVVCRKVYEKLVKLDKPRRHGSLQYTDLEIGVEIFKHYHSCGTWFPNRQQTERYIMKVQAMLNNEDDDFEAWATHQLQTWFRNI